MIVFPNAKINLGLNIIEKRQDGYHNIETVFYPIPLCDALEIIPSLSTKNSYNWSSTGIEIDAPTEQNICIKALNLIKSEYDIPSVDIHLHKAIPFGAGLGGGSSDAASVMLLLNTIFNLNISNTKLKEMAARLGADCPVFIDNKPAFATGIGDCLTPININLEGYHLLLVKPDIFIATPKAYWDVRPQKPHQALSEIVQYPINDWKHLMTNDFEESVFKKHPDIKEIKNTLYAHGALYASMSGSGSSVFGIFEAPPHINFNNCFTWQGRL